MSPIDPYLGAQAPAQDFIRTFLDREIPAGLLFYAPFLPQTGNQAWGADKRIVVPTTETVDSDGSYFASDGLIRRARANALRMEGLGGLIEGARTNLQIRSEEFNAATWTKWRVTCDPNVELAPDGQTTADELRETVVLAQHVAFDAIATVIGQPYVATVFAKLGGGTDWIHIYADATPVRAIAWFNLNTGVVGTVAGTSAPWAAIERFPNGWFRCTLGWTAALAGANQGCGLASADAVWNYLGSTSRYAYYWGYQVENATFPTSYIPTVAAAVTRAQENIQYASANHIARDGTLFCAFTPEADSGDFPAFRYYVDTRLAAGGDGILLQNFQTPARVRFMVRSGGGWSATLSALAASVRGQTYIAACTWRTNNFRLYLDGVLQASDVAGAPPAAHNVSIYVGQQNILTDQAFANIAHLAIFNRSMSIDEVIQRSHFFRNQMARAS